MSCCRLVAVALNSFAQATLAQNLLETAVPPCIARSLLAGTHPDALARSFHSATIAFILLEDYSEKVDVECN